MHSPGRILPQKSDAKVLPSVPSSPACPCSLPRDGSSLSRAQGSRSGISALWSAELPERHGMRVLARVRIGREWAAVQAFPDGLLDYLTRPFHEVRFCTGLFVLA